MPDDHEQIVVRRRKLAALREQGTTAYPNDFRPDQSAGEAHARFGGADADALATAPAVRVAGRVVALRDFGKAGFLKLQDPAGTLQVHALPEPGPGRRGRRRRPPVPDANRGAHAGGRRAAAARQVAPAAAREVAWAAGRR